MTILVFYEVGNALGWEREQFDCLEDDVTFKKMWEEQEGLNARFYNMDTKSYSDKFSHYGILNADEFETDYNDEVLDGGGFWCKVLHVAAEFVFDVISYGQK